MYVRPALLLLCLASVAASTWADTPSPEDRPLFDGFITAVSPQGIDLNGAHLRFGPDSLSGHPAIGRTVQHHGVPAVYLGEPAKVFGTLDKHTNTVLVNRLLLLAPSTSPVSGMGVIDEVPASPPASGPTSETVRADGRHLLLTAKTTLIFDPPLATATPRRPNLWIKYSGEQQTDGTVLVREAELRENVVVAGEGKLREKNDYDPAAVDPDSHQSTASRLFLGVKVKQIPPWPDPAMQDRVERIGRRLIPAYQRALPNSDATKINFRFQVVDEKNLKDALTLPNGIIVLPHQIVERLENDSQLATVLADNIATAIEKQSFRSVPAVHKMKAAEIAGAAGGLFVPGLSVATSIGNYSVVQHLLALAEQQSGRVSLGYLHDAGFDMAEAPRTWWLLKTKPGKLLAQPMLPSRAADLYAELGRSWRGVVSPEFHEEAATVTAP